MENRKWSMANRNGQTFSLLPALLTAHFEGQLAHILGRQMCFSPGRKRLLLNYSPSRLLSPAQLGQVPASICYIVDFPIVFKLLPDESASKFSPSAIKQSMLEKRCCQLTINKAKRGAAYKVLPGLFSSLISINKCA